VRCGLCLTTSGAREIEGEISVAQLLTSFRVSTGVGKVFLRVAAIVLINSMFVCALSRLLCWEKKSLNGFESHEAENGKIS
jgi:hypothetical protein